MTHIDYPVTRFQSVMSKPAEVKQSTVGSIVDQVGHGLTYLGGWTLHCFVADLALSGYGLGCKPAITSAWSTIAGVTKSISATAAGLAPVATTLAQNHPIGLAATALALSGAYLINRNRLDKNKSLADNAKLKQLRPEMDSVFAGLEKAARELEGLVVEHGASLKKVEGQITDTQKTLTELGRLETERMKLEAHNQRVMAAILNSQKLATPASSTSVAATREEDSSNLYIWIALLLFVIGAAVAAFKILE